MKENLKPTIAIFEEDIIEKGGYEYVSDRLSCQIVNKHNSNTMQQMFNFKNKKILDVGSGDGFYTLEFANYGVKFALGIDPLKGVVDHATKKALELGLSETIQFMVGTAETLSYPEKFDCAVIRGVLHHVSDPQKTIINTSNWADSIFILEPNGSNPIVKILEKTSKYHIEHDEQSFTAKQISTWLENANFRVVDIKYVNTVPMLCPDWFARLCSIFTPLVEAIPGLRKLCCGQILIVAEKITAEIQK